MLKGKGKVYYGMHFYPGVAEYSEPGQEPYRVFLNEETIRQMDSTFPGRPVFVEHVDEVEQNVNKLREDADGWVIESFYNQADGKHWVKFIAVTDAAEQAIKSGFRLSNAYMPKGFGPGGLWNGVSYAKEVQGGEYDHLAIVRNPRYQESVIMTPEQFKAYNQNLEIELQKIANSKDKGVKTMKLNLFKRAKVENAADFESVCVTLPKSGKEMTLSEAVETADKFVNMQGYASGDHMVKVGENEMSVNDLVKAHTDCMNEMTKMKEAKENGSEEELATEDEPVEVGGDMANEEDEEVEKAKMKDKPKKENEEDKEEKEEKKKNSTKRFNSLKNAHLNAVEEVARVELSEDRVKRGIARYGSN